MSSEESNGAQVHVPNPRTCDLCESSSAEWKCVECNQNMCQKCKKIHVRQTATRKHQIVEVKHAETGTKFASTCTVHDSQPFILYCDQCEELVCNKCITGKHSGHKFLQIEEIIDSKKAHLAETTETLRELLQKENNDIEKFQKEKKRVEKSYTTATTNMNDHIQKFIRQLEQFRDELGESVERAREESLRKLKVCETKHVMRKAEICKLINESEAVIQSSDNVQIVLVGASFEGRIENLPLEVEAENTVAPRFVPHFETFPSNPEDLVGKVEYNSIVKSRKSLARTVSEMSQASLDLGDSQTSFPKTTVRHTFQHASLQDSNIGCIAPISDIEAWVGSPHDQNLYLVRKNGSLVKTFSTEYTITDIAATPSGDLIVSSAEKHCLKLIKDDNQHEILTTFPAEPHGVFVTKHGDFLVCLSDGDFGRVVKYSETGKMKKEFGEYIINKETFLLRKPIRCIVTPNQDIWILDEAIKRIIVLDKTGNFRFRWEGPLTASRRKDVDPSDLASDEDGNVLVTDYDHNKIYVVSSDGSSTKTLEIEDKKDREPLSDPFGIALRDGKYLWVGCEDGVIYFMRYNLR